MSDNQEYCKHCYEPISWDGFDWYHDYTMLYCCWNDTDNVAEPGGKPPEKKRKKK